jgi:hypothetical protein
MHVFAIGIEDAFDVACVTGLSSHLFGVGARIVSHNTPVVL